MKGEGGADIAQQFDPRLAQPPVLPEVLPETETVICGRWSVRAANFPLSQGNRPDSTITLAMTAPWPMNLVAEWTTMSAPHSIGRHRNGVAKVLSIINGMSCEWAHLGDGLDVEHVTAGLPIVSVDQLGPCGHAWSNASGDEGRRSTAIPIFLNVTSNCV